MCNRVKSECTDLHGPSQMMFSAKLKPVNYYVRGKVYSLLKMILQSLFYRSKEEYQLKLLVLGCKEATNLVRGMYLR